MNKTMKYLLSTLLIIALIFSLSACGLLGNDNDSDGDTPPKSITITLNPNGGTVERLTIIGEAGSIMELPSPTREEYTFDAWYNGWNIISNTVFPNSDITLTARYYANEDTEQTIASITTELNKEYGGIGIGNATGQLGRTVACDKQWFDAENWEKIDYLRKNATTEITVTMELETRTTGLGLGTLQLTGANAVDNITQTDNIKSTEYQKQTLTGIALASKLVGSDDTVFRIIYSANLGSTSVYFRNINISISYIEKSGTLV